MAEIRIHRCRLRIVRRGGWSWGPDPKRFVDRAVGILPQLLAERLAALYSDGAEVQEYSQPVRVAIRLRADEFLPPGTLSAGGRPAADSAAMQRLGQKLEDGLRRALGVTCPPTQTSIPVAAGPRVDEPSAAARSREIGGLTDLERMLFRWAQECVLEQRLELLGEAQIAAWHDALLTMASAVPSTLASPDVSSADESDSLIRRLAPQPRVAAASLRRARLQLAVEAAMRLRVPLQHPDLRAALDRYLPSPAPTAPEVRTAAPQATIPDANAAQPDATVGAARGAGARAERSVVAGAGQLRSAAWEIQVPCALPFLLLPPLARTGYLDAIGAALEAAGLSDQSSQFAAALANKVLDAPLRGWRRTPGALASAAAFVGRRDGVAEEEVADFARGIAGHLNMADVVIADTLVSGHTQGMPLLLGRADLEHGGPLLLLDCEGAFPVAWASELATLMPLLLRLRSSPILVAGETATPGFLSALGSAGLIWIADVAPTRGEQYRRLQQGIRSLGWTNSHRPASGVLLSAGRRLPPATADASRFCEALLNARPAVVPAASGEFDRSLTLAAGLALATIAWTLWHERGATHPALVLERFCDLGARVRFDDTSVRITLPLGRRHSELRAGGLLDTVRDVPWLGGRSLEFGGG
jgi:hypothetical protein